MARYETPTVRTKEANHAGGNCLQSAADESCVISVWAIGGAVEFWKAEEQKAVSCAEKIKEQLKVKRKRCWKLSRTK